MITIKLTWKDLSEEFKAKILHVFGDNCNWDVVPMTIMEIEDDRDIVLDSWEGDEGIDFESLPRSFNKEDIIACADEVIGMSNGGIIQLTPNQAFIDGVLELAGYLLDMRPEEVFDEMNGGPPEE